MMLGFIRKILGPGADRTKEFVEAGATILDVRTVREYSAGHVPGSVNIPLDELENRVGHLKQKDKPIITCCASGIRSRTAKSILEDHGFTTVHNGGSWFTVRQYVRS